MSDTTSSTGKKTAGLLDVRTIIGSLLGIYGVILALTGILGDADTDKTGGVNANLWAGVALLVVGGGFILWWKLRPIVLAEPGDDHEEFQKPPSH